MSKTIRAGERGESKPINTTSRASRRTRRTTTSIQYKHNTYNTSNTVHTYVQHLHIYTSTQVTWRMPMHWKPCTVLAPATYCSTTAAGNPNPSARRRSLTGIVMNSWRKKRRGASNMLHNVQVRMMTQAYSSNGRRGSTYSTKHKTHFTVRTHVSSRVEKTPHFTAYIPSTML